MTKRHLVTATLGVIAQILGTLTPTGRRYRRRLGLSLADQYLIEEIQQYVKSLPGIGDAESPGLEDLWEESSP